VVLGNGRAGFHRGAFLFLFLTNGTSSLETLTPAWSSGFLFRAGHGPRPTVAFPHASTGAEGRYITLNNSVGSAPVLPKKASQDHFHGVCEVYPISLPFCRSRLPPLPQLSFSCSVWFKIRRPPPLVHLLFRRHPFNGLIQSRIAIRLSPGCLLGDDRVSSIVPLKNAQVANLLVSYLGVQCRKRFLRVEDCERDPLHSPP